MNIDCENAYRILSAAMNDRKSQLYETSISVSIVANLLYTACNLNKIMAGATMFSRVDDSFSARLKDLVIYQGIASALQLRLEQVHGGWTYLAVDYHRRKLVLRGRRIRRESQCFHSFVSRRGKTAISVLRDRVLSNTRDNCSRGNSVANTLTCRGGDHAFDLPPYGNC